MQHTPRDRTHSKIAALTGALIFAIPVGALAAPVIALTAREAFGPTATYTTAPLQFANAGRRTPNVERQVVPRA